MKTTTFNLGPGAIIEVGDTTMCVRRWATTSSVWATNVDTGFDEEVGLADITFNRFDRIKGDAHDLIEIDQYAWEEALTRYSAIRSLLGLPSRSRTRAAIVEVAQRLFVSPATIYRWLEKVETYGTISCLLRKTRNDKGIRRLDSAIERVIEEAIATQYLTSNKKSIAVVYKRIEIECHKKGIVPPSKGAVVNRIHKIHPEEQARKRSGRNAALPLRPSRGSMPGIDYVHAIWQIDHTFVDIELVSQNDRLPIGRPWITVAIDLYTRLVVGWYVSFDPPGAIGTGLCISRAILPKNEFLAKLGIAHPWPCQGKPTDIQSDNAKEFRGEMLQQACGEHGINLKFRKIGKPNYGAHIESFLGTLMAEIHALEGTTFSNPRDKGDYNSEAKAVMTLDEFELWLANLILGDYHQRRHSALNCSPLKKYEEALIGTDETPGLGEIAIAADPEKLQIDFMPVDRRVIHPEGVVWDNITYHHPALDRWIGAVDPQGRKNARKFLFRRDPRDISYIIFWDPEIREYFRIPYRDSTRPAMSLWELKRINAYLKTKGKKDINEDVIFKTRIEMQRIEDDASKLTKKVRRDSERRQRHRAVVPPSKLRQEMPLADPIHDESKKPSAGLDLANVRPFDEIEPA